MEILIIIILVVVFISVLLAVFSDKKFSEKGMSKMKGDYGELKVREILGVSRINEKYVLNDFMIEQDGKSVQIDHILINHKGVFVIETKNYSGRIYGSDDQLYWVQVLGYGKVKNKIYNPVKQNNTHLYYLSKILPGVKLRSVVVFVQNNTRDIHSNVVIPMAMLKYYIENGKDVLSDEVMKSVYIKLLKEREKCTVTANQHIEDIKKELNDINNNICPRCGGKLVLRNGKYGKFYACSNFPKCKFKKKC